MLGMQLGGSRQRRTYVYFALSVLAGIFALELVNTARILATPKDQRRFPQGYVSRGVWTAYAFIRPPDATSSDIADPLCAARRVLRRDPSLYREFDGVGADYVYPPTAAIELLPFALIARWGGDSLATQSVDLAGRIGALAILLVTLRFLRRIAVTPRDWALAVVVILAFFPLRWALCCVNVQSLINAFVAAAILAYGGSRRTLCGILLGLANCLKPHLAVVVLFAVVRREWRVALSAVATAAILMLVSVAALGLEPWVAYVRDVLPTMLDGYAVWGNQSILGLARRWVGDPYVMKLVPASVGVSRFGWCASAVLLALALAPRMWQFRSSPRPGSRTAETDRRAYFPPPALLLRSSDIGIALLAITMASPIAWDHHYGWTVVVFAVSLAVGRLVRLSTGYYLTLAGSYVLLATDWIPVAADRPGPFSLLDSTKLLAAVLLCGATWYAHRRLCLAGRVT